MEIFKILNKSIELFKEVFQGKEIIINIEQEKNTLFVFKGKKRKRRRYCRKDQQGMA